MIETRTFEGGSLVVFEPGQYGLPPEHVQIALAVEAAYEKLRNSESREFILQGPEGVRIIVERIDR